MLMTESDGGAAGASGPRRSQPTRSTASPELARIGEQCAARRMELRLTQQTLANLTGVSRYSVQALEHGTGSVKLASVVKITELLGLRVAASSAAVGGPAQPVHA